MVPDCIPKTCQKRYTLTSEVDKMDGKTHFDARVCLLTGKKNGVETK